MSVVAGDVTDAACVVAVAAGGQAAISAAAEYGPGDDPDAFFAASSRAMLAGSGRLVVVGLSVLLDDAVGAPLLESAGIPAEFRPFCLAHGAGLGILRAEGGDVDWLYVSPAGEFDHGGRRTGRYRVVGVGDMAARISYADFAVALLDEIDSPTHRRIHLAVAG